MTLWLIAIGLALVSALLLLAAYFDWHAVEDVKSMWRWWTVRLQTLSALLTGWLFFDPSAMLYAFNLLPLHVRNAMPDGLAQAVSIIGGIIFALNVLAILARGVDQPKARRR